MFKLWCERGISLKLKSELIKSLRNAPWSKSTDGSCDVKCTDVALVSVTCQFKPIGSLRSSANAGNSKINSSRAGSLYLTPFFSPALGHSSPSKQVSLLAGFLLQGSSLKQNKAKQAWLQYVQKSQMYTYTVCRECSTNKPYFSCHV